MKFKSQVYSQVSGSVGGLTYAHNAGGLYTRARSIPTNPATPAQVAVRSVMAQLTSAWQLDLTEVQREAWQAYAIATPIVGPLGDPRIIPALAMYVRCNSPRLVAGLARVDNAPSIYGESQLTTAFLATADTPDQLSVTFTPTDTWATAAGGALLLFVSRPQKPTINFWKGPYLYAGRVNGAATPPTAPAVVTSPYTYIAGQKVFCRAVATTADGRLSAEIRFNKLAENPS